MSGDNGSRGAADAPRGLGRRGRPPLTERRKATTRLEIAHEAIRLFTSKGVAATSVEEIAAAGGVSVRTLWRYFPHKESCVQPLLTAGLDVVGRSLRGQPGQAVAALVDDIEQGNGALFTYLSPVLDLVRLTRTEPGLRAVWLQVHDDAEFVLATALAERSGLASHDLSVKVQAAMINSALRTAVEHYAFQTNPTDANPHGLLELVRTAWAGVAMMLPQ